MTEINRYAHHSKKTYRDLLEALAELSDEQLDRYVTVRVGDSLLSNVIFFYIFDSDNNGDQMDEDAYEVYAEYCVNLPILEIDATDIIALNKNQIFLNLGRTSND